MGTNRCKPGTSGKNLSTVRAGESRTRTRSQQSTCRQYGSCYVERVRSGGTPHRAARIQQSSRRRPEVSAFGQAGLGPPRSAPHPSRPPATRRSARHEFGTTSQRSSRPTRPARSGREAHAFGDPSRGGSIHRCRQAQNRSAAPQNSHRIAMKSSNSSSVRSTPPSGSGPGAEATKDSRPTCGPLSHSAGISCGSMTGRVTDTI